MKRVVAILCADIHLSHRVPTARSNEKNWYEAMDRMLSQVRALQKDNFDCPVIVAGDLFDRWDEPAELINFAIDALPKNVYAIPGQHDLPHHGYGRIKKSAYWTLVSCGRIANLNPGGATRVQFKTSVQDKGVEIAYHGFPWGSEVKCPEKMDGGVLNVAVIHSFVWSKAFRESKYPGVSVEQNTRKWRERLEGFDLAVFGDNHFPFHALGERLGMFNCGVLIRRTKKEYDYRPRVGLLYDDGSVESCKLHRINDVFTFMAAGEGNNEGIEQSDVSQLIDQLKSLDNDTSLDYAESVRRVLNADAELRESVKSLVLRSLESR